MNELNVNFAQVFSMFFLFMTFMMLICIGMLLVYIGSKYMDLFTDKIDKYFEQKGKK